MKLAWRKLASRNISFLDRVYLLRLLQTLAGVLRKKFKNLRTRCSVLMSETPTNYICVERLLNVDFDKGMFCFDFCLPKAATEVINSKMTG